MATLGDMVTRIKAEMGRGEDATVRQQVVSAIEEARRRYTWFSERRSMLIELTAGQVWYSKIGFRSPSQATAAQITAETNTDTEDIEYSLDDFPYEGTVSDILRIDWIALDDYTQRWPMDWLEYQHFEMAHQDAPAPASGDIDTDVASRAQPTSWTRYGAQIGVFPIPDQHYLLRLSGQVRPLVPSADGDSSIWFDEAEEYIRIAAKKRLARDNYRDMEAYQAFALAEQSAEKRLRAEYNRRKRSRIKGAWEPRNTA